MDGYILWSTLVLHNEQLMTLPFPKESEIICDSFHLGRVLLGITVCPVKLLGTKYQFLTLHYALCCSMVKLSSAAGASV